MQHIPIWPITFIGPLAGEDMFHLFIVLCLCWENILGFISQLWYPYTISIPVIIVTSCHIPRSQLVYVIVSSRLPTYGLQGRVHATTSYFSYSFSTDGGKRGFLVLIQWRTSLSRQHFRYYYWFGVTGRGRENWWPIISLFCLDNLQIWLVLFPKCLEASFVCSSSNEIWSI